jgi:hypothetical protein
MLHLGDCKVWNKPTLRAFRNKRQAPWRYPLSEFPKSTQGNYQPYLSYLAGKLWVFLNLTMIVLCA